MAATQKHTSETVEHYTPADVVAAATELMGGIMLDPASCKRANRVVRARRIFTKRMGRRTFEVPWRARSVFLNPPGGKEPIYPEFSRSNPAAFWQKLVTEWEEDLVGNAVFVGFSLEIMQTTQMLSCRSVLEFPMCVTRTRPQYDTMNTSGVRKPGTQPPGASVYVYLPPKSESRPWSPKRAFQDLFSPFGKVLNLG